MIKANSIKPSAPNESALAFSPDVSPPAPVPPAVGPPTADQILTIDYNMFDPLDITATNYLCSFPLPRVLLHPLHPPPVSESDSLAVEKTPVPGAPPPYQMAVLSHWDWDPEYGEEQVVSGAL